MFTYASSVLRSKINVEVELTLTNETSFRGSLFLSPDQRVLDTLNDARKFMAFKSTDGVFYSINKSMIAYVQPIDQTMGHAKPVPLKIGRH